MPSDPSKACEALSMSDPEILTEIDHRLEGLQRRLNQLMDACPKSETSPITSLPDSSLNAVSTDEQRAIKEAADALYQLWKSHRT
jgi:hypothetical protein